MTGRVRRDEGRSLLDEGNGPVDEDAMDLSW